MKVHFTTLGCPKNQVDSELMLGLLTEAGFPIAERAEDAECLVVNTCAFIDRAREESVNTILELARLKDGNLYAIGANTLFQEGLPVHREIAHAAKTASASYPPEQMAEGWIAGMAIEAALRSAGAAATPASLASAMQALAVDTKGLRGGPIEWTKQNHFRTRQYYRVYRWDAGKAAIVRAEDWLPYDVK